MDVLSSRGRVIQCLKETCYRFCQTLIAFSLYVLVDFPSCSVSEVNYSYCSFPVDGFYILSLTMFYWLMLTVMFFLSYCLVL